MGKKSGFSIIILLLALFLLKGTLFIVNEIQSAVIVQLGKPVRTITSPGLHFKLPFMQHVLYFDNRLLDYDASPRDVITQDKKTIVVDNYAKWKIKNPLKVYQAVRDEIGAQARLDDIIYSELRVAIGTVNLTQIISGKRDEIMKEVTRISNKKANEYGIEIMDVRIKRADLPPENERAVYTRMQAEREREAKRYRSEGEEEAQKIRSLAEREKEIILAQAYKEAEELRGKGDAAAFKIYAEAYKKDPDFFQFLRTMEAYKKSIDEKTTLIISPESEFFRYLKKSK